MTTTSELTSSLNNYESVRDKKKDKYICDCGRKCMDKADLDQHKLTNCENRLILCSFCQEAQPSSGALSTHLMSCGNKTDQCPNCRKYIRRAIFAYHFENNCADFEETDAPPVRSRDTPGHRPRSSSSRPASRENVIRDRDQENDNEDSYPSKSTDRIRSSTSKSKHSSHRINCEYCGNECAISDYVTHKDNCLRNPTNVNKQFKRTSLESNQTRGRSPMNDRDASNSIVHIPCEYCNEPVDLSNWATHTQDCREKEIRRIETRAKTINREPIVEQLPCEHCAQLFSVDRLQTHEMICDKNPVYARATKIANTDSLTTAAVPMRTSKLDRDLRLSSTLSSLQPSPMSTHNLSSETRDILKRIEDQQQRSALQNDHLSSHSNTDFSRRNELDRLGYTGGSHVFINTHNPSVQRKTSNDNGLQLINTSHDVPAYDSLLLMSNEHRARSNYSQPFRSGSTTSLNIQQRSRREMPPTVSSNSNSLRSRSASRDSRNERGSEHPSSAMKSLHSMANKTVVFNSPRAEDQKHQPRLNQPDRTTTKPNKLKRTPLLQPVWKH